MKTKKLIQALEKQQEYCIKARESDCQDCIKKNGLCVSIPEFHLGKDYLKIVDLIKVYKKLIKEL